MAEKVLHKIGIVGEEDLEDEILAHEGLEVVNQEQDLGQSCRILWMGNEVVSRQRQMTRFTETFLALPDPGRRRRRRRRRR